MRNYRFSIEAADRLDIERASLSIHNPELIHQIQNVLRLSPQSTEQISFIDGRSPRVLDVKIETMDSSEIRCKILRVLESPRELALSFRFFVPVIKAEAFEMMLKALTQLGIQEFTPVIFERSQKSNIDKIQSRSFKTRLVKLIRESTEQCEGAIFSHLREPIVFSELAQYLDDSPRFYASERLALESHRPLYPAQGEAFSYSLLVGPEGGLSDREVESLSGLAFQGLSLGPRLLKAEIAAIVLATRLIGLKIS